MNLNDKERDTSLITLYIAKGSNVTSVREFITKEQATAQNIKSKSTRTKVIKALKRINRALSTLCVSEKGAVMFSSYKKL